MEKSKDTKYMDNELIKVPIVFKSGERIGSKSNKNIKIKSKLRIGGAIIK